MKKKEVVLNIPDTCLQYLQPVTLENLIAGYENYSFQGRVKKKERERAWVFWD